ncbi:27965_t:CDS:2 [Dentiscutata erythropus]|uniref:27965_t:CDS:1 n=1 Tax=Dentiscutata erythropus TaxID=1348616 RepID=A0A9N9NWD9_9GLOM|nr:27965_t:CDS:2 [Dentiscutata erythropus]
MNFKDTHEEPGKIEKIFESLDIESFAEKLGLYQFTKIKDDLKKFYDFAGSDFTWPSTMDAQERCVVFDYITDPEWSEGGVGRELATNTIAYRKFLESKTLDPSKGTHVLLVHGQIKRYGQEISANEYDELVGQGFIYAPIIETMSDSVTEK